MRTRLSESDLLDPVGTQCAALLAEIMADGKINLDEIKDLRIFLREHKDHPTIAGIRYLHEIMTRITADMIIDRDELRELAHAIYSVMPKKNLPEVAEETAAQVVREAKPPSATSVDPPTQTQLETAQKLGIAIDPAMSKRAVAEAISQVTGEPNELKQDWGEYLGDCPTSQAKSICNALAERFGTVDFLPTDNGNLSAIGYRRIDGDDMPARQIEQIDDYFETLMGRAD